MNLLYEEPVTSMGPFHCLNGSLDYSNILLLQMSSVALPFFFLFLRVYVKYLVKIF